jgi:sugar phosphate isomerase/epimerase
MYPAIFGRTYSLTNSSDVLAAAAADGYRGVQFNLLSAGLASLPEELPDGLAEQVRDAAQTSRIRLAALSGTYNMAHPDPNIRAASRRGFRNVVEAARRMGAPIVTLCTGSRDPNDMWKRHPDNQSIEAWSVFRGELDFALGLAETAGIKLGVEPEPGNVVNDADAARRLLDEVASPLLGSVLDAANLLSSETLAAQHEVIEKAAQLLGDSLLLAHAKDIDYSGHVTAAGEGAVDLAWFVTALRAVGYDGALVGHGFSVEKTATVSKMLAGLIGSTA